MTVAATLLRRLVAALVLSAVALAFVADPASAAPDPEGGTKSLRAALESSAKGHVVATQKLKASQKRQKALQKTLVQSRLQTTSMQKQVTEVAGRAYRLGRFNTMTMLLDATSPDAFLERAQGLDVMARFDSSALTKYRAATDNLAKATTALALEIKEQEKQVAVRAKKKKEAELALAAAGGGGASGGFVSAGSAAAQPAPRNSDGSWPPESCTVDDPTTDGCITPRLLHAYQQARADGFTHFTSCFRSQEDGGEHPRGRACDFAADTGGFGGEATGDSKTYGNSLAAYFVNNADQLGVLYVIWFQQIWMPGTGWQGYSGSGSPSAAHTNHVHLSVI